MSAWSSCVYRFSFVVGLVVHFLWSVRPVRIDGIVDGYQIMSADDKRETTKILLNTRLHYSTDDHAFCPTDDKITRIVVVEFGICSFVSGEVIRVGNENNSIIVNSRWPDLDASVLTRRIGY